MQTVELIIHWYILWSCNKFWCDDSMNDVIVVMLDVFCLEEIGECIIKYADVLSI